MTKLKGFICAEFTVACSTCSRSYTFHQDDSVFSEGEPIMNIKILKERLYIAGWRKNDLGWCCEICVQARAIPKDERKNNAL